MSITKILLIFSAIVGVILLGCASMMTTTTLAPKDGYSEFKVITCERAIKYHSNRIDIEGISFPITVIGKSKMIQIGKISVRKESIENASDLIKSLDLLQFTTCQDMLQMKNEENKMKLSARKARLTLQLSRLLSGLNSSTSQSEYDSIINVGKTKLEDELR